MTDPAWFKWKPDCYGYIHNGQLRRMRRHSKCRCVVPCQMRFQCRSRRHIGKRATPWCCGGDGASCNECWAKNEKAKEKRA